MSLSVTSNSSNSWESLFHLKITRIGGLTILLFEEVASYLNAREVRNSLIFFSARVARLMSLCPSPYRDFSLLISQSFPAFCVKHIANKMAKPQRVEFCPLNPGSMFQRDFCVTLPNGKWLLPATFKKAYAVNVRFKNLIASLLPSNMKHTHTKEKSNNFMVGYGIVFENRALFLKTVIDSQIPYTFSQCCLEGGNVHLFQNSLGEWKAIIGITSLITTLHALEWQNFFKFLDISQLNKKAVASDEAIRIARNYDIFGTTHGNKDVGQYQRGFFRKLRAPLTLEDKKKYAEDAKWLEVKLAAVKKLISMELEIPLHNIAFVPHFNFHIDMEITIGSDDCVMVHDDRLAVSFLKSIINETSPSDSSSLKVRRCTDYLEAAEERLQMYNADETMKLIRNIGCQVFPIVGMYENRKKKQPDINFCNGVRLGLYPSVYITNGAPNMDFLQNAFAVTFKHYNPNLSVEFLEGMTDYLTKKDGGLRCMSLEFVEPKEVPNTPKRVKIERKM